MPHSLDAERALLGGLLIDPAAIKRVRPMISVADFYMDAHARIYDAILSIDNGGGLADVVSVVESLSMNNDLEKVGGASRVSELIEATPTAANITNHAQIMRDKKMLRDMIQISTDVISNASNGVENVIEFIDRANVRFKKVADVYAPRAFMTMADATFLAMKEMENLASGKIGLSTGIPALDDVLLGLQKTKVYLISAYTKQGKTALMNQIVVNSKAKSLVVTVEGSGQALASRQIFREAGVDRYEIYRNQVDFSYIIKAAKTIIDRPIIFDKAFRLADILSSCRRAVSNHGVELLAIDYLQLINTPAKTIREKVIEIIHAFANLAGELNVPILLLVQCSRKPIEQNRPPKPSDLQESAALEQATDAIIFIYSFKDESGERITKLKVDAHRDGVIKEIPVDFDGRRQIFTEKETRR